MTATPISYDPALEREGPDEARIHEEMLVTFDKIQSTTLKDYGHAVRGVHAKAHGLLTGHLEVLGGLPAPLAQGLFARPGRYDAVLRLSTNPGDILDDSVSTPRGLALKLVGVEGARLPGAEGTSQDFVLANAPAFVAPDAAAFLKSLKLLAATTDTPQIFKKALSALLRGIEGVVESLGGKSPKLIALGGHPETHILGETFYSQIPLRWGDYVAKVALAPVSPGLTALTGAALNVNGRPNGLREAVTAFFAENEGVWELRAQLRTGANPCRSRMPRWAGRRTRAPMSRSPAWSRRARRPGARRGSDRSTTDCRSARGTASRRIARSARSCGRAGRPIRPRRRSGPGIMDARSTNRAPARA